MPKIFTWKGYKFFFYANEGEPLELCHIHVRKGECTAKFWLEPDIELASSYGLSGKDLNEIRKVIIENQEIIRRAWNEFFKYRS